MRRNHWVASFSNKSKILSYFMVILLLSILASIMPITIKAADDFEIQNGVLTKYNGSGGDVIIPSDVTSIGESVFK